MKTDLLFEDEDMSAGNAVYHSIVTRHSLSGTEATEFSYWGRRLMDVRVALLQDSKLMSDLTTAQVTELAIIADSAQMWAKVRARGWLSLYDGREFVTDMMFPGDDSVEYSGYSESRMAHAPGSIAGYSISPNPWPIHCRFCITMKRLMALSLRLAT